MVKIRWTEKSSKHLKSIYDYIATDSKVYARRYVQSLVESTEKLKRMPECGRKVPEFESHAFREIIFRNHRIVYRISDVDGQIDILAVVHGAQDLLKVFSEGIL